MSPSKASVVVPTFNAGPGFRNLLEKLFVQETDFDYEVLVIDSGSMDGTVELARGYGASIHRIDPSEFDHGATRNRGIAFSTGEYIALTVQDAVPLDSRWLATMVEVLEQDDLAAGVYGRQIPRPESDEFTRVLVNSWPVAGLSRREQFAGSPERYRKLPADERRRLATFDNVSSCLRRSVWEEIPFEKTSFGEDVRWGKKAVEAGYKIVYEPRSAVIHSHDRGAMYDLRRHYVDQRVLLDLFGPSFSPTLLSLPSNVLRSTVSLCRRLYKGGSTKGVAPAALAAVKYAALSQVGAYLGGMGHRLARISPGLSSSLNLLLGRK